MIIVIKEKDRAVVGFSILDSWSGLSNKDYVDEENVALKFSKTGNLFAFAEMHRRADLFIYEDDFIDADITPKSIVKEIIPYMKYKLDQNGLLVKEDGRWNNALTICCSNGRVYDIGVDFKFSEVSDYVCHGYRVEVAGSVLDETTSFSAEERIVKAFAFISEFYKEQLFPIVITDTKTKKMKVIHGEKDV